jgi:hypothetical protein
VQRADFDDWLHRLAFMDRAGLLGATANELRAVAEAGDPALPRLVRRWSEAFPILDEATEDQMRAVRSLPAQVVGRDRWAAFARAQQRRLPAIARFAAAVREGLEGARLRWSWSVRGYARDLLRFMAAAEARAALLSAGADLKRMGEPPWSPLKPIYEAALKPYLDRMPEGAETPVPATHATVRSRAWSQVEHRSAADFQSRIEYRNKLVSRARRLAREGGTAVPQPGTQLEVQIATLERWIAEEERIRETAAHCAACDRLAALVHTWTTIREFHPPGGLVWLKRYLIQINAEPPAPASGAQVPPPPQAPDRAR